MLECVINVSEGRDPAVVDAIAAAGGACVLDVHSDPHHHRSVITLAGEMVEEAARSVAAEAVRRIDLRAHAGAHPRLGAVDVVPFVPVAGSTIDDAIAARDRFARWVAATPGVPCFVYGPERSLPDVRRSAFTPLQPDFGPAQPHPTAGAVCVGARPVLVAYNVWLAEGATVADARRIAASVRGPSIRSLGFDVGGRAQVSMNLIDPFAVGPAEAFDLVGGGEAELVGLLPEAVLAAVAPERWPALDLSPDRTIEARLARAARTPLTPG